MVTHRSGGSLQRSQPISRPVLSECMTRTFALPLLLLLLLGSLLVLTSARTYESAFKKREIYSRSAEMSSKISPPNEKLPQMWEISTRPWLYALSQKYAKNMTKLSDIPMDEFQNLRNKGIDVVWLMGLWRLDCKDDHKLTFSDIFELLVFPFFFGLVLVMFLLGEYGLKFDQTNPGLEQVYNRVLPGWTKPDVIGSPYAVWSYEVNPELGTLKDLQTLKSKLNQMGLKLMVDFVPNHSAVDSPWAKEHPEYYVRAPKGASPPLDPNRYWNNSIALGSAGWWGSSWMDTLQYNYWDMSFRKAQTERLVQVASVADYIRCDMAYLCLNDQVQANWNEQLSSWGYTRPSTEFWGDAIKATKAAYPKVQFLAEVYDPWGGELQSLGFDFTYDKHLYDLLGDGNLDNLRGYIANTNLDYLSRGAHFVENHDEPRAAAFFGSNERADAAAMVAMTVPGMRFYNEGQQDGLRNRLQVQLRRSAPEPIALGVPQFYDIFMAILARPVFHTGQWTYLPVTNDQNSWRLMAWKWTNNQEHILVVVNYSDTIGAGSVVLSDAQPIKGNDTVPVTDLISHQVWERSVKQMQTSGLFTVIQPWSCQILQYWQN